MDRSLKGVTHVIVDEIHERGMNEGSNIIVLFQYFCYIYYVNTMLTVGSHFCQIFFSLS